MELLDAVYRESEGFVQLVRGKFDKKLEILDTKYFSWPAGASAVEDYVARHADSDVYFSTSLLSRRKRLKETATVTNVVYVDADECHPAKFKIQPSLVVETSPGRYHAYWFLSKPMSAHESSRIAKTICEVHREDGCDKSGWTEAKLLRVPGTRNTKRNSPVEITDFGNGEEYTAKVMRKVYPPAEIVLEGADADIPKKLPPLIDTVSKLDFDLLVLYRAEPEDGQSYSELLWKFIHQCFGAGLDRASVFQLAKATKFNKYARDGRPESDLWAEVLRGEQSYKVSLTFDRGEDTHTIQPLFLSEDEREKVEDNFVDAYEEWIHSRSPLASRKYARFTAFFALSNVYGSWVHISPKIGNMSLNLWGMILGPSSSTKKTTVVNLMLSLLKEWEERLPEEQRGFDVGSDFTPEGLNNNLAERDKLVSFVHRDEISGFLSEMLTKSYLSGGIERMTALFDGKVLKTLRATKGTSQQTDATTIFNFLGLGIEQHTASALTLRNFQSGFLPRFIWCIEDEPEWTEDREIVEQQTDEEASRVDPQIGIFCNQFSLARRKWDNWALNGSVPILMTPEALHRFNEFAVSSKYMILGREDEENLEASRLRLQWTVWKCAALLAIHERSESVELKHLLYVLREAEVWFADLVRMASKVAESDFSSQVNELETYIVTRRKPPKPHEVYRRFEHLRKGDVDELLVALQSQGRIVKKDGYYQEVMKGNAAT